jgi:cytidine deaminase
LSDPELLKRAAEAKEMAYAPYSGYRVGAALLCNDGSVVTGCNVENISFGATICAERCAVVKAVSEGKRDFKKNAISVSGRNRLSGRNLQTADSELPRGILNSFGANNKGEFKNLPVHSFCRMVFI